MLGAQQCWMLLLQHGSFLSGCRDMSEVGVEDGPNITKETDTVNHCSVALYLWCWWSKSLIIWCEDIMEISLPSLFPLFPCLTLLLICSANNLSVWKIKQVRTGLPTYIHITSGLWVRFNCWTKEKPLEHEGRNEMWMPHCLHPFVYKNLECW